MKQILTLAAVLICLASEAQKVIFRSAQTYTKEHLESFYSSFALQNNLLVFNAPDYNLYAYDKSTGALRWTHKLGCKSNVPPFFVQDYILTNNQKERVVQLDTATGRLLKTLPFYNIASQPLIRNGIWYTTGIYNAGNLLAYDPRLDSVLWYRFLAHGYSRAPYYKDDRIWANGEADTWFELDYNGRILTPGCDTSSSEYPYTASCSQAFIAFTHDGKKITEKLGSKLDLSGYEQPEMIYADRVTLVLNNGTLHTLGNRGKLKASTSLQSLLPEGLEENALSQDRLLRTEGDAVWLLFNDQLMAYDFKKKRLLQRVDLSAWEPHHPLLEGNRIWFVSQKDGLLYGVQVD